MAKVKISDFSSTAGNNTEIDNINISEGCAPSGINNAIRELMAQLKDFQTGAAGDSFNGPVGTATAAAGAFTTLAASGTVSGTGFSNYLASPPAIGGTAAAAGSFTTLTTSSTVTHNGGTANGVAYLNGSKVLTTGSALTFDGTTLGVTGPVSSTRTGSANYLLTDSSSATRSSLQQNSNAFYFNANDTAASGGQFIWRINSGLTEQMRLTSTGLGIGTSSPAQKLHVSLATAYVGRFAYDATYYTDIGYGGTNTVAPSNPFRYWELNGSEQMRLTSTGLGIGTSSPVGRLSIIGSSDNATQAVISGTTGTTARGLRIATSSTGFQANDTAILDAQHPTNAALVLQTGSTERLRITSAGNVGIGTSLPGAKLHIFGSNSGASAVYDGTLIVEQGSAPSIQILSANSQVQTIKFGDPQDGDIGRIEYSHSENSMRFATNNTERLRIDSAGNVGIGTSSPASKLDVAGGLNGVHATFSGQVGRGLRISTTNTLNNDDGVVYNAQTATSGKHIFQTASIERMRINSDGNVGIGTSSPSASAILDAQSTTKGVRMPNMTTTQKNAIASPAAGLMVFDTTLSKLCVYSGAAWETITSI